MLALEDCLEELTAYQSVADLRLKRVLLEQEYLNYKEEYRGISEQKKELKEKPSEIIKYEYMLKRASFYYNRGEGYSGRGNHKMAHKFISKADGHFEKLYEYLQEISEADQSLWQYFDRTVEFTAEKFPSLTPDDAPRYIASKSHHNLNKTSVTTRNECKITAIESAILNLKYVIKQQSSNNVAASNKLQSILDKQFDDDF